MRNYSAVLAINSLLIAVITMPSAPHARDLLKRFDPKINPEEIVKPDRMNGAMNSMMNMKDRMKGGCKLKMGPMMDGEGALKPNEQWRTKPPVIPKKDG